LWGNKGRGVRGKRQPKGREKDSSWISEGDNLSTSEYRLKGGTGILTGADDGILDSRDRLN